MENKGKSRLTVNKQEINAPKNSGGAKMETVSKEWNAGPKKKSISDKK